MLFPFVKCFFINKSSFSFENANYILNGHHVHIERLAILLKIMPTVKQRHCGALISAIEFVWAKMTITVQLLLAKSGFQHLCRKPLKKNAGSA